MNELLQHALAETTWNSYNKIWQAFQLFSFNRLGVVVQLPLHEFQVAQYVTYLYDMGYCHSTIATTVSVLAFVHKLRDLPDPTSTFLIRKLLVAVKKQRPTVSKRQPITWELLRVMVDMMQYIQLTGWEYKLLKAVMLVMYVAGLRVGEVLVSGKNAKHTALAQNLFAIYTHGVLTDYLLKVPTYKHSNGDPAWIKIQARQPQQLCPVKALYDYMQMRGPQDGFLFVHDTGIPVRSTWFTDYIRMLMEAAGLDPKGYAPHSFRAGATTDLVSQGASQERLRAFGRWKTTAYTKYVKHNVVVV